jgi:membrane protease YdiL (CAAX protease family)
LTISWTTAGFGEEFLMRGFMLTYLIVLLSRYMPEKYATGIAVAATATTFGLMHFYQGLFGVFMTGFAGLLLAIIYLRSDRNLWLVVVVHGVMNSLGFLFMFFT